MSTTDPAALPGTAAGPAGAPPAPGGPRASTALAWSTLNTVSSKLASIVIGVFLARTLGPEEFGVFAVAMVALLAVLSFNELGVSLAIVRWPGDPARIAPTVTSIAVGSSAVVTLGVVAAAGPFAQAMGAPDAAGPVRLLALCILVNGIVATPAALLQRGLRQDRRMVADQVNIWLGAVVSLALVVTGFGAMGLVVGRVVGAIVSGGVLLRFSPLPWRLGFDRSVSTGLLRFGAPLAGASVVVFALGFTDQLVVGHQLGPVALGAFVLAVNLAGWPIQLLSQPLRSVAPAVFSRLQDRPEAMRSGFVGISRPLLALTLPACVALAVCAEPVVRLLYGPAWDATAAPLRWLALLAAARILAELAYDYLVIVAPSWWLLVLQLGWWAVMLPALFVGASRGGLAGAALAQLVVAVVLVLPAYAVLLRLTGLSPWRLAPGFLAPVLGSAVILVGGLLALRLPVAPWPPLAVLAVTGLVSAAVCAVLLHRMRADIGALRRGDLVG